jgi:hypothetical protein
MAEIKSTLELAMERTKRVKISETEKEEIKQKEILQKATSLFHRYREGHHPLNEILKEIERMEKKTAATVKESLVSQWIDALSLDDDNERILKGIESLKQGSTDKVKEKLHPLLSQYRKEKEKIKEVIRGELTEKLKSEKIDGSAVDLKIEGSELWRKENEKLGQHYEMKLEEIKQQLRVYK